MLRRFARALRAPFAAVSRKTDRRIRATACCNAEPLESRTLLSAASGPETV